MRLKALMPLPILAVATMPAAADQAGGGQGRYDHMMWGNGYGMLSGLMMIVFWGVIIALVVFAVKWITDNRPDGGHGKRDALAILRERFAAGEIDEEEFERRKKVLET